MWRRQSRQNHQTLPVTIRPSASSTTPHWAEAGLTTAMSGQPTHSRCLHVISFVLQLWLWPLLLLGRPPCVDSTQVFCLHSLKLYVILCGLLTALCRWLQDGYAHMFQDAETGPPWQTSLDHLVFSEPHETSRVLALVSNLAFYHFAL
ncbi:hypothetical protein J3F84DRAFT_385715 [Trichoderma pleuroticola]